MANSDEKGKRFERKACRLLESLGYRAMRSKQNSGEADDEHSADILTTVPGVRFEVKGGYNDLEPTHKKFEEWVAKAEREAGEGYSWAILWKKNRNDWTIVCNLGGPIVRSTDIAGIIDIKSNKNGPVNWPGE